MKASYAVKEKEFCWSKFQFFRHRRSEGLNSAESHTKPEFESIHYQAQPRRELEQSIEEAAKRGSALEIQLAEPI
uniref:Uncharacterized protein n=1 Tax=Ditylenchus dipsaci TaxID=166011 RepID=A0A915EKC9_9BILA